MRTAGWSMSVAIAWLAACGDDNSSRDDGGATETMPATATDTESSDPTSGEGSATTGGTVTASGDPTSTSGASDPTTDPTTDPTSGETEDPSTGSTGGTPKASSVLLSIDNGAAPPRLVTIDLDSAISAPACDLPPTAVYDTMTFLRTGKLLAHNAALDRIEAIDPCTCGFQVVGPTGIGSMEMTANDQGGMYGVDPDFDAFVSVNPDTGLASVIGPLGFDLMQGGIAFSDADQLPFLVDPVTDQLHTIDVETGMATAIATITANLSTAGVDFHEGELYACSGDNLYTIDTVSGQADLLGPMGLIGACNNLAAPPEAIACLR